MSGVPPHRDAARADDACAHAAVAVLTVSDTRTAATDRSGDCIVERLEAAGHRVVGRGLVRDDPPQIVRAVRAWIGDPEVAAVLITGGTGLAARDVTVDSVRPLFAREIDGFGELFRRISYDQVGTPAMLSRATAGVAGAGAAATLVFCLPGSTNAVDTAVSALIVPELPHLLALLRTRATDAAEPAAAPAMLHGVDLVEVARIGRMLEEHGERFLARCFTAGEQRYCDGPTERRAERYAARFAAKEAVLKAIGTGWRDGIAWTDVEVVSEPSGQPRLALHGVCAEHAAALGASRWSISLTHAGGFAFASVAAR